MPRGDISSEAQRRGESSTYQLHHGNIFKSIFTLGLSASFLSSCYTRCLHFLSKNSVLKTRDPCFDSKEQGRFKRNGPNLNSERIKYSAYQVHRPDYSSFTSRFLWVIVSFCTFKCELAVQVQISLTTDQLLTSHHTEVILEAKCTSKAFFSCLVSRQLRFH